MPKQTLNRPARAKPAISLADGRQLPLSRPLVMGIVNVTPDSFSDGGRFDRPVEAARHALEMERLGADIIDIGGESTRPGAEPVSADDEIKRVRPVIEAIRNSSTVPISIDTYKAATARAALDAGADMINDISALRFDPAMAGLVAETEVTLILMHMLGTPRNMQDKPHYDDCVGDIAAFFAERIGFCRRHGINPSRLILDPGIGFGKRLADNLAILANLKRFTEFGLPLLVGASRKSFINMLHPTEQPAGERLGGSIAAAVTAVANGADIVRVHDVAPTVEALRVTQAIGGEK